MTTVKRNAHLNALFETVEIGFLGGTAASIVDTIWCLHDIYTNGLNFVYVIVLTGLLLSSTCMICGLVKHHRNNVKQHLGMLYEFKKTILFYKNRHKEHLK